MKGSAKLSRRVTLARFTGFYTDLKAMCFVGKRVKVPLEMVVTPRVVKVTPRRLRVVTVNPVEAQFTEAELAAFRTASRLPVVPPPSSPIDLTNDSSGERIIMVKDYHAQDESNVIDLDVTGAEFTLQNIVESGVQSASNSSGESSAQSTGNSSGESSAQSASKSSVESGVHDSREESSFNATSRGEYDPTWFPDTTYSTDEEWGDCGTICCIMSHYRIACDNIDLDNCFCGEQWF